MIHRIHSSMLLASFALALAACGGGGGGGGAPAKLSAALLDSIQRFCQKTFDCKSSYDASMHGGEPFEEEAGGTSVDACVNSQKDLLVTVYGPDFTKLDDSVAAGRIKYTANDYDTCVAAGESQTCDQFFEQNHATDTLPAACDTYKVGQVATAGACTIDDDCAVDGDGCDMDAHTCG